MRVKYKVTIKGMRPYLHHSPENALSLEDKPKPVGSAGNNPNEWRDSVYIIKSTRELYIPSRQIFGTCRMGAKHTKKGRGSISGDVVATLLIEGPNKIPTGLYLPENWEAEPLTTDSEQEVYLDVQPVRNPTTRGLNMRYRVAHREGWQLAFEISFDNSILAPEEVNAVLIDAGALYGIGNGRNIGFGRFDVISFEEI